MLVPAGAPARVLENRRRYDQLVALTRMYARRGHTERVLLTATVAANYAWNAPVGILNDPDLERVVVDAVRQGGEVRVDRGRTGGRVLHVLTEAYPVGGHSRLAWHWIERDQRTSDVVLTNQGGPVPDELRRAAHGSGGRVFDLRSAFPGFLTRTTALRRLMDQADVVVLHVHPFDVLALAAANLPGPRPPVVLENHADHTYWLGLGAADLVADNRATAGRLCREFRGVRPDRLGLLPLPVDPAEATKGRKFVRSRLGVRPEQVLALTVAGAKKMSPVWGEGFDDVLRRALTRTPDLAVALVGVPDQGPWRALKSAFPRRVFPLGMRGDTHDLQTAADLYLDSYPLSGGTALLEAAAAGLPVLSLEPTGEYGYVYQADAPGLDPTGTVFSIEEEFLAAIDQLVADPELRVVRGEEVRGDVLARHAGPGWQDDLENLYRRAGEVPMADLDEYPVPVEALDYAATLVPFVQSQDVTPDPVQLCGPLGDQMDQTMQFDLFVTARRELGVSLSVRVSPGWEANPAWMMRLIALAMEHPRLSASLPFVAGDAGDGSLSLRALEPVLAANGATTADCDNLSLDAHAPVATGARVSDELALHAGSLDLLEALLTSPCWDELPVVHAGVPGA